MSCVKKLSRHKNLEEFKKLNRQTIEDVFKSFKPIEKIIEETPAEAEHTQASMSDNAPKEKDLDNMIREIIDMFPHLGDGMR